MVSRRPQYRRRPCRHRTGQGSASNPRSNAGWTPCGPCRLAGTGRRGSTEILFRGRAGGPAIDLAVPAGPLAHSDCEPWSVVMKPRQRAERKGERRKDRARARRRKHSRLLSVRSALVLELALSAAIVGAVLLFAAHRSPAQIALGGVGIFAASLKLADSLIDR